MKFIFIFLVPTCLAVVLCPTAFAMTSAGVCSNDVVGNPGFELPIPANSDRPPYWYIGFPGEPLPSEAGSWALDTDSVEGTYSLRLNPVSEMAVTQILHLPASQLSDQAITVSLRAKHSGLSRPPTVTLVAINPESPFDSHIGTGVVGKRVGQVSSWEGIWTTYRASLRVRGPAQAVAVIIAATGPGGTAWFDNVIVRTRKWIIDPYPNLDSVTLPISHRTFDTGFVVDVPMDSSDLGMDCHLADAAATGDVVNVFFHVRWCAWAGQLCESDPVHRRNIELVQQARQQGLKVAMTLDFTHGTAETVGDLNPFPNGDSPGTLLDSAVREAYRREILWLYDQIHPEYVLVGIEVNIMYDKHPDWWDAYVAMERDVYDAIKMRNPAAHVSAYHTLDWTVDSNGQLIGDHVQEWRKLLPHIDSIAFSTYPNGALAGVPVSEYPVGYFSRAHEIEPGLPILVPEFGTAGGGSYTNGEQAAVLRQMVGEFASANPVALIWYQPVDNAYFGAPTWFTNAFSYIGMRNLLGAPKESFGIWKKLHELPRY